MKSVVDLILRAADAKHVRREPRSAVVLENLQDFLPLAEAIEEHRDCSEINGVSAEPKQMTRNAIQLCHDHTNVLRARRRRDAEQLLYGFTIAKTIGNRRDVIHTVESGNELAVRLGFPELFHAPVQVPDDTLGINDPFTIELQFHLKHAMCRRVLGTHADGYFACIK